MKAEGSSRSRRSGSISAAAQRGLSDAQAVRDPRPASSIPPATGEELKQAFRDIGLKLSKLHLSK